MALVSAILRMAPAGILILIVPCLAFTSNSLQPSPYFNKKVFRHETRLRRATTKNENTSRDIYPYQLGLTPYLPRRMPIETQNITSMANISETNDINTTEIASQTDEKPLSYLHLLQIPDRGGTNSSKQIKIPKPIIIDEWMAQLPSKWAAFVADGYKYNNNISFPSTTNNSHIDHNLLNGTAIGHSDAGMSGIGTFESTYNLDEIWNSLMNNNKNNTFQGKISRNIEEVKLENGTKISTGKSSTQPQSIFTSNFSDTRKNVTSSVSPAKPQQQKHPLLAGKDPNDIVTVADLEAILRYNNYYRTSSMQSEPQQTERSNTKSLSSSPQKSNKGGVAFPQPSLLSNDSVKWGATVSGGLMGVLVAISAAPNLWLMGILFGCAFGYDTGQRVSTSDLQPTSRFNVIQTFVIYIGRQLARTFLKVYDAFQAFFFMYKTGQLSYEYYKSYAAIDKRFSIQKKIDAWNSRFVEGKLAFDRWEKENEIGRKVLAGLRTAWLVEERNVKKRTGLLKRSQRYQSRYRVVQLLYDTVYTIGRLIQSWWNAIVGRELGAEVRDFVLGLRQQSSNILLSQQQIRGIFGSVVALSFIGAIFTVSPLLLALVATAIGWIWPTWVSEIVSLVTDFVNQTIARGRGQNNKVKTSNYGIRNEHAFPKFDKNRYHFYLSTDGKKRYYRVGKPWSIHEFVRNNQPRQKSRRWFRIFNGT